MKSKSYKFGGVSGSITGDALQQTAPASRTPTGASQSLGPSAGSVMQSAAANKAKRKSEGDILDVVRRSDYNRPHYQRAQRPSPTFIRHNKGMSPSPPLAALLPEAGLAIEGAGYTTGGLLAMLGGYEGIPRGAWAPMGPG